MTTASAALSLEQTPPLAVPLRFFLTAPLFGAAACVVALFAGPTLLATRWQPSLLAVTHLLTLGYLAMVMGGAMFQLLPVLAGVQVTRSTAVSVTVHLLLVTGTVALALAFVTAQQPLFGAAIAALGVAVGLLIVTVGRALFRARSLHDTVWAMRLAVAALAVTLLLGAWLAAGHAGWGGLMRRYTDLHLAWGLLGWCGMLIIAVAYQVVPMFQVTREYPRPLRRSATWLVGMLLLLATALTFAGHGGRVAGYGLAAFFALFAVTTLRLQQRRLRRLPDVTVAFWRVGMANVIAAVALWLVQPLLPAVWLARSQLCWGALVIIGAASSLIGGMLYKIVPFLVWLHLNHRLQAQGRWQGAIPNMKQVIAERAARRHLYAHVAGTLLLLAAIAGPGMLIYPAAVLLGMAFVTQWWNLLMAVRLYQRVAAQWEGPVEANAESR